MSIIRDWIKVMIITCCMFSSCSENEYIPDLSTEKTIQFTVRATEKFVLTVWLSCDDTYIDWGDGEVEFISSVSWDEIKHYYPSNGIYTVRIVSDGVKFLNLQNLNSSSNIHFSELILGDCPQLHSLYISGMRKQAHFQPGYCPMLENISLWVSRDLISMDLSGCPNLTAASISSEDLETIDISENKYLRQFTLTYNNVSSLDLSNNTALTSLQLVRTPLTSLDISNLSALQELYCRASNITTLDLSGNPNLLFLDVCESNLTELNAVGVPLLSALWCDNNQLEKLEIGDCLLRELTCSYNKLSHLDLSQKHSLRYLNCAHNLFDEAQLNEIFSQLPTPTEQLTANHYPQIRFEGNPGEETCNSSLVAQKLWTILREEK